MRYWPNVGLLLSQRRKRWVNSNPTLDQRFMRAGMWMLEDTCINTVHYYKIILIAHMAAMY